MYNITSGGGDDDCEGSGQHLWWLGVILGLLGSIFINTGNNLQSLGMHELAEAAQEQVKSSRKLQSPDSSQEEEIVVADPMTSGIWRIGTTVFISGALLNFVSYAFAAQSMLASLEAIQFVTNIIFSKCFLKKTITYKMYCGTLFICAGTIIAVANSSKKELCATANDLIQNYTKNPAYQTYLGITIISAFALQGSHLTYQKYSDAGTPLPGSSIILPVTYAAFSAIFGTQSVVQAKCLAELLEANSPTIYPVFLHWFTYAALAAWLALVAVWLYRMNEALSLYDPIFIIPLLQTDFILLAIIAGGIYFREFDDFTTEMWFGFIFGMVIVFIGLFMLAPGNEPIEPRTPLSAKVAPEPLPCCTYINSTPQDNKTNQVDQEAPPPPTINETQSTPPLTLGMQQDSPASSASSVPRIARVLPPLTQDIPPALDPVQIPPIIDDTAQFETPRSKSLDRCNAPKRKRPPPRIAKTPLNFVTSISAQYNINELGSARSSRSSFDRPCRPVGRRRSFEVSNHKAHPTTLREDCEDHTLGIVDHARLSSTLNPLHETTNITKDDFQHPDTQGQNEEQHNACMQTI